MFCHFLGVPRRFCLLFVLTMPPNAKKCSPANFTSRSTPKLGTVRDHARDMCQDLNATPNSDQAERGEYTFIRMR